MKEKLKEENKPSIETSIYDCTLIIQKIEEWASILNKAKKGDSNFSTKDIDKLQKKIGKIGEVIYQVHGTSKYPDELISKLYYSNYYVIEEIKRYYENWNKSGIGNGKANKVFVKEHIMARGLLETFPRDEEEAIEDILEYIINGGSYEEAVRFTAEKDIPGPSPWINQGESEGLLWQNKKQRRVREMIVFFAVQCVLSADQMILRSHSSLFWNIKMMRRIRLS